MNNSLILKCPKCGHHFYQWPEDTSYCGRCYKCGLTLPPIRRDDRSVPISQQELERFVKSIEDIEQQAVAYNTDP